AASPPTLALRVASRPAYPMAMTVAAFATTDTVTPTPKLTSGPILFASRNGSSGTVHSNGQPTAPDGLWPDFAITAARERAETSPAERRARPARPASAAPSLRPLPAYVGIGLDQSRRLGLVREPLYGAPARSGAKTRAELFVREQSSERRFEGGDIAGRHKEAGDAVLDCLRETPDG